jgi:hypothetical protein
LQVGGWFIDKSTFDTKKEQKIAKTGKITKGR